MPKTVEFKPRRIYVASSWRNLLQQAVVAALRRAGHEVYDYRQPAPGEDGFRWSDIDPDWLHWDGERFRQALSHPTALKGFGRDFDAMVWADCCVLVLPCGRSAHLEAGWFAGRAKPVYVFMLEPQEPELMYRLCDGVLVGMGELFDALGCRED